VWTLPECGFRCGSQSTSTSGFNPARGNLFTHKLDSYLDSDLVKWRSVNRAYEATEALENCDILNSTHPVYYCELWLSQESQEADAAFNVVL
jgi:hypothetical protein